MKPRERSYFIGAVVGYAASISIFGFGHLVGLSGGLAFILGISAFCIPFYFGMWRAGMFGPEESP